jgi:hypothetical protein
LGFFEAGRGIPVTVGAQTRLDTEQETALAQFSGYSEALRGADYVAMFRGMGSMSPGALKAAAPSDRDPQCQGLSRTPVIQGHQCLLEAGYVGTVTGRHWPAMAGSLDPKQTIARAGNGATALTSIRQGRRVCSGPSGLLGALLRRRSTPGVDLFKTIATVCYRKLEIWGAS